MTEPAQAQTVLCTHEAGTMTVLLNRPGCCNALSHTMLVELGDALSSGVVTGTDRVLITGAGDCFSAGADIRGLNGSIDDLWIDEDIEMVTGKIRSSTIPVIARVNGPCIGGAVDIALSCDQRIAGAGAYFQVPATKLGLLYNPVSVERMVKRYGRDLVRRLLVDGERFDACKALDAGFVSSVDGEMNDPAPRICHPEVEPGPAAVATLAMIDAIDSGEFDRDYWEGVRREILDSRERREAIEALKARMSSRKN